MFSSNNSNTQSEKNDAMDPQDLKKKREQYAVEIRKQKREELLQKKRDRNLDVDQKIQTRRATNHLESKQHLKECVDNWLAHQFDLEDLPKLTEAIFSADKFKQHYGAIGIRKIVSDEQEPPIQSIIDSDLIPRFIEFAKRSDEPLLQSEAAQVLANLASGTTKQTEIIIDKGGIPCLIELLKTMKIRLVKLTIPAIGNISADCQNFRDLILRHDGIAPLIHVVTATKDPSILKDGMWAISNLCSGEPLPEIELIEAAVPVLCQALKTQSDPDVLVDAAWSMSYISRVSKKVAEIIQTGLVPFLVKYMESSNLVLVLPCLQIIGNILNGSETQKNVVLSIPEFIPMVFALVKHQKNPIRRESCWIISNITASNSEHINMIMGSMEYVEILMQVSLNDLPEIQREAVCALVNATENSIPAQIAQMIKMGVLDCFITLVESEDTQLVKIVLEGMNNIINWGAYAALRNQTEENEFLAIFQMKTGVSSIEELLVSKCIMVSP